MPEVWSTTMRRARTAAALILDRVDEWRHRSNPRDEDLLEERAGLEPNAADRQSSSFDREWVLSTCGRTAEIEGRSYRTCCCPGVETRYVSTTRRSSASGAIGASTGRSSPAGSTACGCSGRSRTTTSCSCATRTAPIGMAPITRASRATSCRASDGRDPVARRRRAWDRAGEDRDARLLDGGYRRPRFALRLGYSGVIAVSPHIDLDVSVLNRAASARRGDRRPGRRGRCGATAGDAGGRPAGGYDDLVARPMIRLMPTDASGMRGGNLSAAGSAWWWWTGTDFDVIRVKITKLRTSPDAIVFASGDYALWCFLLLCSSLTLPWQCD